MGPKPVATQKRSAPHWGRVAAGRVAPSAAAEAAARVVEAGRAEVAHATVAARLIDAAARLAERRATHRAFVAEQRRAAALAGRSAGDLTRSVGAARAGRGAPVVGAAALQLSAARRAGSAFAHGVCGARGARRAALLSARAARWWRRCGNIRCSVDSGRVDRARRVAAGHRGGGVDGHAIAQVAARAASAFAELLLRAQGATDARALALGRGAGAACGQEDAQLRPGGGGELKGQVAAQGDVFVRERDERADLSVARLRGGGDDGERVRPQRVAGDREPVIGRGARGDERRALAHGGGERPRPDARKIRVDDDLHRGRRRDARREMDQRCESEWDGAAHGGHVTGRRPRRCARWRTNRA
jgi:hypothetical protein